MILSRLEKSSPKSTSAWANGAPWNASPSAPKPSSAIWARTPGGAFGTSSGWKSGRL